MSTIAALSPDEPHVAGQQPGGLWATLEQSLDSPTIGVGDLWRGLERRLLAEEAPPTAAPASSTPGGLWQALATRVDPLAYCPRAIPDVAEEQIVEGDQRFTIIRSARGNYLRLTPLQRDLWHLMDGTRTVSQLATHAFLTSGQLPPDGFIATLKQEGFLSDAPVGVYRRLDTTLEARTPEGWGRRMLRTLTQHMWRIEQIDSLYAAIYRLGGWLLFTRLFALVWLLVVVAGLVVFVRLLGSTDLAVVQPQTVTSELAVLWVVLLVSFLLHESAHALTVKHFGRSLYGGGVMLYFGLPAFFVDTTDIWRSSRRARMLVSAAGPMSDLFVGALAALFVAFQLAPGPNSIAYKLALTCYVSTLVNFNPLLELDGYYILVDWLRLPDLRRRAIAFVRGPLWRKFGYAPAETAPSDTPRRRFVRQPFSREEHIFTLYGLLTLAYTLVALIFALQFWQQLTQTISDLWTSDKLLGRIVAAILGLLIIAPIVAGLVLAGFGVSRSALDWVLRRGYGRRPALLACVAGVLVVALATLVSRNNDQLLMILVPPVLWAVALSALLALRPDYRGAAIAPALDALSVATALLLLGATLKALVPDTHVGLLADGVGMLFLLIAGFAALLDVNLRLAPPRERLATALLLVLAFAAGGRTMFEVPDTLVNASPLLLIAGAAPAYFGVVALALLLPHLFALHDSRLVWSWGMLWIAALAETAAYVFDLKKPLIWADTLAAGLWAGTWLVHLATQRQIAPTEITWSPEPSISEEQRLARAFEYCYIGCYRLLRAVYGARRTRELDDRMDVLSATANWDVTLDQDRVRIGESVRRCSLDQQGERFAEVLRYTVATVEDLAGAAFARRAIRAVYDALPWPERETASRLCFPDTPWARELSASFGDVYAGRLRLLRQVDLFLNCNDEELAALVHSMQEQTVPAGRSLLRAGAEVPGVWVIEAGEISIERNRQIVDELHRGDAFGAQETLDGSSAPASYRAAIASSLLFIPAAEFRALVHGEAPHAAEGLELVATLRLLERVPIFADLPRNTLRGLLQIAQRREFPAHSVVIRQGAPSGTLYIIRQGRAVVLVRGDQPGEKPRVVARLGPEEFCGEGELLTGTPPIASVVTLTPLVALAFPHAAIHALIMSDRTMEQEIERYASARRVLNREHAAR